MPANVKKYPYTLNTRVYSCILIDNSVTHRWRGKYNEDTDLSLRVLKDGHCTILVNPFTCGKVATLTMGGGNTEEVYKLGDEKEFDNRYKFAKSLYDQHPDVVTVTQKWGRFHHEVDYSSFKNNKLILKKDIVIPREVNNMGLRLAEIDENGNFLKYIDGV